jgi:hypothetical protein
MTTDEKPRMRMFAPRVLVAISVILNLLLIAALVSETRRFNELWALRWKAENKVKVLESDLQRTEMALEKIEAKSGGSSTPNLDAALIDMRARDAEQQQTEALTRIEAKIDEEQFRRRLWERR